MAIDVSLKPFKSGPGVQSLCLVSLWKVWITISFALFMLSVLRGCNCLHTGFVQHLAHQGPFLAQPFRSQHGEVNEKTVKGFDSYQMHALGIAELGSSCS